MLRRIMTAGVLLASQAGFAQDFAGQQKIWAFDAQGLSHAEIGNDSRGTQIVTEADRTRVEVDVSKQDWDEDNCSATASFSEGTLRVEVGNTSWFTMANCQALIRVKLSENLSVETSSGLGPILLRGTFAKIAYSTGAGAITAQGRIGSLVGSGGGGPVVIWGLLGGVDIRSGRGMWKSTSLGL